MNRKGWLAPGGKDQLDAEATTLPHSFCFQRQSSLECPKAKMLNSWDLNNPMGKWPNGETWPKGETAQRGKCGSTLENDQTGV